MENKTEKTKNEQPKNAPSFTKKQLVSSEKYADRRDVLNVLLADGRSYTFEETDRIINDFMKRKD